MQVDQQRRAQLQHVRTHRANHELPDLGDARSVHVGGQQQEHQQRVEEHRGDGLGVDEAVLDAVAHRVQRASVAEQRVSEDAYARRVRHNAQNVSTEAVHERRAMENVRDVGQGEEEDRQTYDNDHIRNPIRHPLATARIKEDQTRQTAVHGKRAEVEVFITAAHTFRAQDATSTPTGRRGAARVVADPPMTAVGTVFRATETETHEDAIRVDLVLRRRAADLTQLAVLAQQTAHRGNGCSEHNARSFVGSSTRDLVNAVQRLLVHDDDRGPRHNLHRHRTHAAPRLDHHLARLEHDVLVLQRRHLAVETQPTQRHAAFAALGAPELGEVVPRPLVPVAGVVD